MTFLVGLAGVAALLPIGRLAVGRWAGLTAIALCLLTGYLYGSLFFTPIDVPFLAAMTWATLAILVMTRQLLPSWRATIIAGLLTGLAIGTRTGGIITHAYLLAAMALCARRNLPTRGRLTPRYLAQIGVRYGGGVIIAWLMAIALWPWLQIGNPFRQFKIALVHFATIPMSFEFSALGRADMDRCFAVVLHSGPACWRDCRKGFSFCWRSRSCMRCDGTLARDLRATWRVDRRAAAARSGADACAPARAVWSCAGPLCCRSGS